VQNFNSRWTVTVICVDLGFCDRPFDNHTDPVELPRYVINLDLPPRQRWKELCSVPKFVENTQYLYKTAMSVLPAGGKNLEVIGEAINFFFPQEYAEEIKGCADAIGIPYGVLSIANLGYELTDDCTSIVAQAADGKILHARNLDFGEGLGVTATLKEIAFIGDFQKGGKTLFITTGFATFVGILSGMRPGAFSLTIDTRFYPEGFWEIFYEVIAAVTEKNASLVSFLARDVLQYQDNYYSAKYNLANVKLIADVYYILAGVSAGQGVVISRNRENASDIWELDPPTRWFEVETNYDHWEEPPWYDNRIDPANEAMNAIGQKNITLEAMFGVLSKKPIFNLMTTYSILTCAATGTYKAYARYCAFPCPM